MIIQESFSYSLLKRTSISNSNSISSEDEIDVNWGNTILNEDVILAVAIAIYAIANKPELFTAARITSSFTICISAVHIIFMFHSFHGLR